MSARNSFGDLNITPCMIGVQEILISNVDRILHASRVPGPQSGLRLLNTRRIARFYKHMGLNATMMASEDGKPELQTRISVGE